MVAIDTLKLYGLLKKKKKKRPEGTTSKEAKCERCSLQHQYLFK